MDQSFITSADLRIGRDNGHWFFQYPNLMFSGGISSSLLVGIYKLLVPTDADNINWHIRIFAMWFYLLSSFLLIRQLISATALRLLLLAILATSGFQFIQPSSELFAASFLTIFLVGVIGRFPIALTSLFLAMFGLAKVEMLVAAMIMAIFWWIWEHRRGNSHADWAIGLTGAWLGMFLLPSVFIQGASLGEMDRSMVAFIFTYAELFQAHQFGSSVQSINDAVAQLQTGKFHGADSVLQFIIQHPGLYADYLGVSAVRGIPNFIHTAKLMIIPMVFAVGLHAKRVRPLLLLLLLAGLCTLIPAWLFTYVRIRYLVKLFPAFTILAVSGCEELAPLHPWVGKMLWISGIGTIIWQLFFFQDMWTYSHWR